MTRPKTVRTIGLLASPNSDDKRLAYTPNTAAKLRGLFGDDVRVVCAKKINVSNFQAGDHTPELLADASEVFAASDLLLSVAAPAAEDIARLSAQHVLLTILPPGEESKEIAEALAATPATVFALDRLPRITRAQSMDVLSSQSNLSGYLAVIRAAHHYPRLFPLMMTAAGTIPPAKVFIMGVGVAGLQAVATAKRLGAVVHATDVRPATKEQVESLGGKFVFAEEALQGSDSAYATELSEAAQQKQRELVAATVAKMDIVITTALIPGRAAPQLVDAEMARSMAPGSVIIDLAGETTSKTKAAKGVWGGNVEQSIPGKTITTDKGVIIDAPLRLAAHAGDTASNLLGRNFHAFLQVAYDSEAKQFRAITDDEILSATKLVPTG